MDVRPVLVGLALMSCGVSNDPIECIDNSICNLDVQGMCVVAPTGHRWCRYPAPTTACTSGYKWSPQAGDGLANQCVEPDSDAGVFDAGTTLDAGPDALDVTPPDTSITSKPSAISGPNVTFAFESTEPGTFECSLDGEAFTSCTSAKDYTALLATPNPHVFEVRARDFAGNVDPTPAHYEWQVDPNALDTTLTKVPPSTSGRDVTFEFSSTRPGTFECKLAPVEAAFSACSSPRSYTYLDDSNNAHTFTVRAIDSANNVDDTPATYQWNVDSTGPVVLITSPGSRANGLPRIVFNAEPGATYMCRFDGGAAFSCVSDTVAPAELAEGGHVVYVRGTDTFGNGGAEASKGFIVDKTPPTFGSFSGPDPGGITNPTTTFTYSVTDDSGLAPTTTCLLDGVAPIDGCASPRVLSGLAFGPHTFSVTARDDVGNAETVSRTWTVTPVTNGQLASVVLGQPDFTTQVTYMTNSQLLRPFGVGWDGARLWTGDIAANRVLVWFPGVPGMNYPSAQYVLGQPDYFTSSQNGVTQNTFTSSFSRVVAAAPGVVAVPDRNRVLIFDVSAGISTNMNAALVLGQTDFTSSAPGNLANQMNAPYSTWTDGQRFIVSDTGNERVLIWNIKPTSNGTAADVALGAASVNSTGNSSVVTASTLNRPLGVFSDGQRIFVADTGNNRVLIWNSFPNGSGVPADVVVGQSRFDTSASGTSPTALDTPIDVAAVANNLLVADSHNNRIVVFSPIPATSGVGAAAVLGQDDLSTKDVPTTPDQKHIAVIGPMCVAGSKVFVTDPTWFRVLGFNLALQ